jgi:hypothetical protein
VSGEHALDLAVYGDVSGESWQRDQQLDDGWGPRIERRYAQSGDPVGHAAIFDGVFRPWVYEGSDRPACVTEARQRPTVGWPRAVDDNPRRRGSVATRVTRETKLARLAEIRAADPDWPHMWERTKPRAWRTPRREPERDPQFRADWQATMVPAVVPDGEGGHRVTAVPREPEYAIAHHAFSAQAWSDVELEWEAQGCPQITATRWGVFIANKDAVYPHGVLVPPPLDAAALASARFLTGRQLAWDEETVELVEATIRAKQESTA